MFGCDKGTPPAPLPTVSKELPEGTSLGVQNSANTLPAFARSEMEIQIPPVVLTGRDGKPFPLKMLETMDRPVALNFIFATCTTICPLMTATFAQARTEMGSDAEHLKMVSITIDPQNDTPPVLEDYARSYNAPPDWAFLTGTPEDIHSVQQAFKADYGAKFNHKQVTMMHRPGQATWVALEGQGSGSALASEFRKLLTGVPAK
jgi:protein SCO1/2